MPEQAQVLQPLDPEPKITYLSSAVFTTHNQPIGSLSLFGWLATVTNEGTHVIYIFIYK